MLGILFGKLPGIRFGILFGKLLGKGIAKLFSILSLVIFTSYVNSLNVLFGELFRKLPSVSFGVLFDRLLGKRFGKTRVGKLLGEPLGKLDTPPYAQTCTPFWAQELNRGKRLKNGDDYSIGHRPHQRNQSGLLGEGACQKCNMVNTGRCTTPPSSMVILVSLLHALRIHKTRLVIVRPQLFRCCRLLYCNQAKNIYVETVY